MRLWLTMLGFVLTSLAAAMPTRAGEAPDTESWRLCATAARAAARGQELPPHLLPAIAKVESGRWHEGRRATIAWPWTVTAGGEGRFLPSKRAAVAAVRALRARGVRNIDVGCMQVNLLHHPRAFADLQQAFDPRANARYAAAFLARLYDEAGSWTRAIGDYHSRTPRFSGRYRLKVFRAWRAEKKAAYRQAAKARRARARLERSLSEALRSPAAAVGG